MILRKIKFFNKSVGEEFLLYALGKVKYDKLDKTGKNLVNRVEALDEFQETGTIIKGMRKLPPGIFNGPIGSAMISYIDYKKANFGLSDKTVVNYNIYLHSLLAFLNNKRIYSPGKITKSHLLSFVRNLDSNKIATMHVSLSILKGFLRYLHAQQFLPADLSNAIPKVNYKNQPHLPSTFSNEEVTILLSAIDRGNPKGKRDYAIILLATKLGLRSSDIRGLKFEHILWEKSMLNFNQAKTSNNINLPLLSEIGNAIIDYLKYGRPVSEESYCFIQIQSPRKGLQAHDINNLVRFHLKRAGIDFKNRKHGPHALRHSFASNLLANKTPLPVISEALGHSKSNSSMYHIRIDINSLKQCAIDVPVLPFSFYNQKGGLCHE